MKWRIVVTLAAFAVACRFGDLVEAPPSGARLEFTVQPSRADTSKPITPPVQVTVRDATGRPDTSYHDSVSLDLGPNAGGATLVGTHRAQVAAGVATFENVRVDTPGDGYVLRATAPGRPPIMSSSFTVDSIPTPDEPDPPVATQLAFSIQPSHTQAGSAIAPAVRVAARDAGGTVVTSFAGTITLAIGTNPGGGTLSGTTSSVASNGVATFSGLSIDRAGNGYTLTAAASGLSGATSGAFNITTTPPPPPPPATQLAFTVQPSNTEAGDVIAPAIQVAARDAAGNLVPGFTGTVTLAFGANPGGGTLLGTTAKNATNGVATFDNLQINQPGSGYTLRATTGGLTAATSVAFTITAPPQQARRVAFTVQPSNTEVGSPITPPIQVAARDDAGNVVTSFGGTITLAIGSNPGGGTLSGTTSSVASNGVATFSGLRIDRAGNGYTLTAAASGLSGATSTSFSITATPPPPPPPATQLAFTAQPSNTEAGDVITPAIQVAARDAAGNVVTSFTGTITIAFGANPGGGTLSGTTSKTATNGVAAFNNLQISQPGSGYTLRATASGLTAATSVAFNITAPPPPPPQATRLAFTVQPSTTEADKNIMPAPRVVALDAAGNVVTSFSGTITIAIGANPGGGTLTGTTSRAASAGVANFGGLRIDRAGNGYSLTATASGLTGATSTAFNITGAPPPPPPPPQPTSLRFIVQPSNTGLNQPISPPVQVEVLDQNGARITNYTGAITIDLAPNLLNAAVYGTTTVNAVNGVAAFSNLRVNLVGVDFRLRAAFAGQAPIATSNAFIVLL